MHQAGCNKFTNCLAHLYYMGIPVEIHPWLRLTENIPLFNRYMPANLGRYEWNCLIIMTLGLGAKLREMLIQHGNFGAVECEIVRYQKTLLDNSKQGGWVTKHYLTKEKHWTSFSPEIYFTAMHWFNICTIPLYPISDFIFPIEVHGECCCGLGQV